MKSFRELHSEKYSALNRGPCISRSPLHLQPPELAREALLCLPMHITEIHHVGPEIGVFQMRV